MNAISCFPRKTFHFEDSLKADLENPKSVTAPNLFALVIDDDMAVVIDSQIANVSLKLEWMNGNSRMWEIVEEQKASLINVFFEVIDPERKTGVHFSMRSPNFCNREGWTYRLFSDCRVLTSNKQIFRFVIKNVSNVFAETRESVAFRVNEDFLRFETAAGECLIDSGRGLSSLSEATEIASLWGFWVRRKTMKPKIPQNKLIATKNAAKQPILHPQWVLFWNSFTLVDSRNRFLFGNLSDS